MSLRLTRAALADLAEARTWYQERSQALEREFLDSVEEALADVARLPRAYPVIYLGARRVLLDRFPPMLLYRLMYDDIVVVGCFHTTRDPKRWRRRFSTVARLSSGTYVGRRSTSNRFGRTFASGSR